MKTSNVLITLLAIGAVISVYLIYTHYNPGALVCTEGKVINCAEVLTSSYSVILGVPLAVYTFVWFVLAMLLVMKRQKLRTFAEIWMLIGIGGMFYSFFAMYMVGKVCIYCSTLDLIIAISIALFFMKQKP